MSPENYGQPGIWPPPPTPQGVWPPAPETAALTVPFKYAMRRASSKEAGRAKVSDFRVGSLQVGGAGIAISGKAVLRGEIRYPIYIVALVLARFLGLIAYLIMEYGFRHDEFLQLGWQSVRLVQIAPQKRQACIVYDAPNYKGLVKTFSLAFTLDPASFAAFADQMQQHVPDRLAEGNLRSVTTLRIWIRLIVLLMIVAAAVIAAVTNHH